MTIHHFFHIKCTTALTFENLYPELQPLSHIHMDGVIEGSCPLALSGDSQAQILKRTLCRGTLQGEYTAALTFENF